MLICSNGNISHLFLEGVAATCWLKRSWSNLRWKWNSYEVMLDFVEKCHIMEKTSDTKWVPSKIWHHTTNTWSMSLVPGTKPGSSILNCLNAFGILVGVWWPCTWSIFQFGSYQSLISLCFNTVGQDEMLRCNIPSVRDALELTLVQWLFQVSLLLMLTPR